MKLWSAMITYVLKIFYFSTDYTSEEGRRSDQPKPWGIKKSKNRKIIRTTFRIISSPAFFMCISLPIISQELRIVKENLLKIKKVLDTKCTRERPWNTLVNIWLFYFESSFMCCVLWTINGIQQFAIITLNSIFFINIPPLYVLTFIYLSSSGSLLVVSLCSSWLQCVMWIFKVFKSFLIKYSRNLNCFFFLILSVIFLFCFP